MDKIGLTEAIESLRDELVRAAEGSAGRGVQFRVDKIDLQFEVAIERTAQGRIGLRFWVIETGGEYGQATARTHRVSVSLVPLTSTGPVYTGDEQIPE